MIVSLHTMEIMRLKSLWWKRSLIFATMITAMMILGVIWKNFQPRSTNQLFMTDPQLHSADISGTPFSDLGGMTHQSHPLQIEYLKTQKYPGSELVIEQTLEPGANYQRHIVSYKSEGLKQYALLTVPQGTTPNTGWPVIIFNHGYIPPAEYKTTEKYIAYVDGFARNGYIVIKPDYRGHGNSEGVASGGYGSAAYLIDVLNALSSIQKYPGVDATHVGMWGHSMGGHITQLAMVINPDIKAGVIWGGVVGSYQDYFDLWWNQNHPSPRMEPSPHGRGRWRNELFTKFGDFNENPTFWNSISVTPYLNNISGPIQLHHAQGDNTVPVALSENFFKKLEIHSSKSELFVYPGDDHNLSQNFSTAMSRSIEFFDEFLK